MNQIRVLCVANEKLPPTDYRLAYGRCSHVCTMRYALPEQPDVLPPALYEPFEFRQGFRLQYLLTFWRLLAFLRRNRDALDVVHLFTTNLILVGPLLAHLAGVQSVITVTGHGRVYAGFRRRYRLLRPVYRLLMTLAMRLARRILFQNYGDYHAFTARFPRVAHKFRYAGSAVDMPVASQKGFTAPRLCVLHVARLLPEKGIDDFLTVARQLYRDGRFEFLLVGPATPGGGRLLSRVLAHHAQGVITYQGELDASALQMVYARAHVLFFPSCGEGMARVMLEAGFACLCPVAYDIPANQDAVMGCGYLFPIGDLAGVVALLRELAQDRERVARQAAAYQVHVVKNYNVKVYARRMDNILLELMLEDEPENEYAANQPDCQAGS